MFRMFEKITIRWIALFTRATGPFGTISNLLTFLLGTLFENVRVWDIKRRCCYAIEKVLSDFKD